MTALRVAVGLGLARDGWAAAETWVREAEALGVDRIVSSETWGFDAATPLAYFAGKTSRVRLMTGIMQVGARTPANVAMTALSLASMTGDRFILGLGASGPQVIEGWHGVPFARPLARLRETVDIVRLAAAGERVSYEGREHRLPLPGGEGRALRSSATPRRVPVYLATLGPRSLEYTGEAADGWIASSFLAEHAGAFIDHIRVGAERVGRSLDDIDRQAGGVVQFSDDVDAVVRVRKPGLAFEIGAMGSPEHNFYKDAYERQGYGGLVHEVQRLWLDRRRDEAAALIPDEFVVKGNFLGTPSMVRDRIRAYRDHGITTLSLGLAGVTLDERLDTLGRFMDLVDQVNRDAA